MRQLASKEVNTALARAPSSLPTKILVAGCYADRSPFKTTTSASEGTDDTDRKDSRSPDAAVTAVDTVDIGDSSDASISVSYDRGPLDAISPIKTVSSKCGDGRVSVTEACDIAIAQGHPGACPRGQDDCPSGDTCTEWRFNEQIGCAAACDKFVPSCQDDDSCCPTDCTSANDSDCASSCGDGVIQKEKGEICELKYASDGRALPADVPVCPEECPKDDDPCTNEELTGSAANCNAVCKSTPITELVAGDGCCPGGANAITDEDCVPICGNGIWEENEECDGTSNCSDQCKNTSSIEQQECIDIGALVETNEKCKACMCSNCLSETAACYRNIGEDQDNGCAELVACGFETGCIDSECYCGNATGLAIGTCVIGAADGPCKEVIEEVAGTTDLAAIVESQKDPHTALGRAQAISDCYQERCRSACAD